MLESQISALLKPISAQNPCGLMVRYTPHYDAIQEARALEDTTVLPEGVWQSDAKPSDWKKVAELCIKMLTTQSKDLQVVAWLTESLLFLEGLSGLNEGLSLLHQLSKKFWTTLYPLSEEEDHEARFVPYEWIDYQIPQDFLTIVISQPAQKEFATYTLADWVDGLHLDGVSRKQLDSDSFLKQEGRPLLSEILSSVKKTPFIFYETLEKEGKQALILLQAIEKVVSEKTHQEVSFFYRLKGQLDMLLTYVTTWKNQCLKSDQKILSSSPVSEEKGSGVLEVKETLPGGTPSVLTERSELSSRKSAYDLLGCITEFLLKEDPHSPTPYLLRQALQWQDKSLPDIYAEFSHDPQALLFLMRLLGVKG